MMVPPGTSCPPKAFTPSRCALESRPFLELPKPFLCAMTQSFSKILWAPTPEIFTASYFFLPLAALFFLAGLFFFAGFAVERLRRVAAALLVALAEPSAAAAFFFFAGRAGALNV